MRECTRPAFIFANRWNHCPGRDVDRADFRNEEETDMKTALMAGVAALSPNHLIRTFRQLFGCTPYQYLSRLRLEAASRLLRDTEQSVTEICFAVGFRSLGSFSARFSKQYGLPPSAYRACKRQTSQSKIW